MQAIEVTTFRLKPGLTIEESPHGLLAPGVIARAHPDREAGLRQPPRDGQADALVGAGDQRLSLARHRSQAAVGAAAEATWWLRSPNRCGSIARDANRHSPSWSAKVSM